MGNLSRLLKESWTLVEEQQDKVASYFYARMFLSNPQLRDLFPVQMDVQRARLLGAIVTAVQTLDDPDRFDEYLRVARPRPPQVPRVAGALRRGRRRAAGGAAHVRRRAVEHRVRPGVARRVRRDRREDDRRRRRRTPTRRTGTPRCSRHERRGRDIAVFTCRPLQPRWSTAPASTSASSARYQPRLWRIYSMANAPRKDGTLDFHVRALGAGWVSSALVRRVKPGDLIRLAAPMGSMTLDRKSTRDIVCVAGGTGLAPIKALIEELTRYNRTRWVHVFFGAKDRDDLYDLAELNRLAARYPWLSVVPACSEDAELRRRAGQHHRGAGPVRPVGGPRLLRLRLAGDGRRPRCARWPRCRCRRSASSTTPSATCERQVRASVAPGPPGLPVLLDRHQRDARAPSGRRTAGPPGGRSRARPAGPWPARTR